MHRYRIQGPGGRTITIEGNTPPSDKEIEELFAEVEENRRENNPETDTYNVREEIVNPMRSSQGLQPLGEQAKVDAFVEQTKQSVAEQPPQFSPVNVANVIKRLTGNSTA